MAPRQPRKPVQIARHIRFITPFTSPVTNQKQEGSCKKIAFADMMSLIFRMFGFPSDLVLSPQIGIDRAPRSPLEMIYLCVNVSRGLERITEYPFSRYRRNIRRWTEDHYENERSLRFCLQNIKYISTLADIVEELLVNFDEDGYRYPCVGGMHMMEFADGELARQHAVGRLPFRHSGPVPESEPEHAMLIVGLDTSSHDHLEHHVIVKNSYGKSWGNRGYSKVAFEALTYVCIPVKQTEAELKVQADAEAAKARTKAAEARARAAKRKAKDMGVPMGKGKEKVDGY